MNEPTNARTLFQVYNNKDVHNLIITVKIDLISVQAAKNFNTLNQARIKWKTITAHSHKVCLQCTVYTVQCTHMMLFASLKASTSIDWLAWLGLDRIGFHRVCFDYFELNASHCALRESGNHSIWLVKSRNKISSRTPSRSVSMCCFSSHCSSIVLCVSFFSWKKQLWFFSKWKKQRARTSAWKVKRHVIVSAFVVSNRTLFVLCVLWEPNRWKCAAGNATAQLLLLRWRRRPSFHTMVYWCIHGEM